MGHIGERKVTNNDERQEEEVLSSNDLLSELLSEKVKLNDSSSNANKTQQ